VRRTQKEDREESIDQQDIFHRVIFFRNRSGRALVMLRLGLMEPLETRGAEMEPVHCVALPHTLW